MGHFLYILRWWCPSFGQSISTYKQVILRSRVFMVANTLLYVILWAPWGTPSLVWMGVYRWAFTYPPIFKIKILIFTQQLCSSLIPNNMGRFCNNTEIDKLISKRLFVENKAKLSQLTRADFVRIAKFTHLFQSDYL